jgi:hypothetical protein
VIGLLIAAVDSSPGWDDTGVTVAMILGAGAVLGGIMPEHAALTAVGIGIWVPAFEIRTSRNFGSLLALGAAFAGAYGGTMMRRWSRGPTRD